MVSPRVRSKVNSRPHRRTIRLQQDRCTRKVTRDMAKSWIIGPNTRLACSICSPERFGLEPPRVRPAARTGRAEPGESSRMAARSRIPGAVCPPIETTGLCDLQVSVDPIQITDPAGFSSSSSRAENVLEVTLSRGISCRSWREGRVADAALGVGGRGHSGGAAAGRFSGREPKKPHVRHPWRSGSRRVGGRAATRKASLAPAALGPTPFPGGPPLRSRLGLAGIS